MCISSLDVDISLPPAAQTAPVYVVCLTAMEEYPSACHTCGTCSHEGLRTNEEALRNCSAYEFRGLKHTAVDRNPPLPRMSTGIGVKEIIQNPGGLKFAIRPRHLAAPRPAADPRDSKCKSIY